MPRPRQDRPENPAQRNRAVRSFQRGHNTGVENAQRGSGRDPSFATRRRTPNADERAGVRAGERGDNRNQATAKRFGRT